MTLIGRITSDTKSVIKWDKNSNLNCTDFNHNATLTSPIWNLDWCNEKIGNYVFYEIILSSRRVEIDKILWSPNWVRLVYWYRTLLGRLSKTT